MAIRSDSSTLADFLDLLRNLIREPSVVGAEDSFFRVLMRELQELDLELTYYQGVLVARGKDPQSLVLSAHIDRHGLVCTGPNEFQYSAFLASNRSEQTGDSVSEQMLDAIQGRFTGQRVQAHIPYTSPYPTREAAEAQHLVLRNKDASAEFDLQITAELSGKCRNLGIECSYKDAYVEAQNETRQKKLSLGRTELGRLIAATNGEISGTTLQIPTTGYHTASEAASLDSIRAALAVLLTYVDWQNQAEWRPLRFHGPLPISWRGRTEPEESSGFRNGCATSIEKFLTVGASQRGGGNEDTSQLP